MHLLLHPRGKSVNCHISVKHGALNYSSIDKAIDLRLDMGRYCILVKRDLIEAFRKILVAEFNLWLPGFYRDGVYYREKYLAFGLRAAPFIFDLFDGS